MARRNFLMLSYLWLLLGLAGCESIFKDFGFGSVRGIEEVEIELSDELEILLSGLPSAGYFWSVINETPETLKADRDFGKIQRSSRIGAAQKTQFKFNPVAEGLAKLKFQYAQVGQIASSENSFEVIVHVFSEL
jgi:predicted secreted protein